jgi:uncharacterized membrane protein
VGREEKRPVPKGLLNPYTGEEIRPGSHVVCRRSSIGVTLCRVRRRRSYLWQGLTLVLAFAALLVIFSVRIEISLEGEIREIAPGAAALSLATVLPLLSILAGTGLAVVFASRRNKD